MLEPFSFNSAGGRPRARCRHSVVTKKRKNIVKNGAAQKKKDLFLVRVSFEGTLFVVSSVDSKYAKMLKVCGI